ncbi:MAG: GAF domain-containing sensor histidine kinase [Thermoplasmata archaeon]|nr:GAF domain-containing sensor histidine kinase [Thermoplasmata archaeon]
MQKEQIAPKQKRGAGKPPTPVRFSGEMLSVLSDIMSVESLDSVLQKIATTIAELFSIRALIICVLDENEQVFRVRAAYGYEGERAEQIKSITYSQERVSKDIDAKYQLAESVYFVRPGPEEFVKSDEPLYLDVKAITRPRTDAANWHELDYLKIVFTEREGGLKGFIEIEEPESRKVMNADTIETLRVFAELAGVAIENAKMYQKQVEIAQRTRYLSDIIAHDINNYNQAVTSYLHMALSKEIDPGRAVDYLERATTAAWSISELIQRADRLTTIEEEGGKNLGPVDLGEVLRESMAEVAREAAGKKAVFNIDLGKHRYFVSGNELVNEIFVNILENAVQYDAHESISVDLSVGEFFVDYRRYWCVSIADNGIGIPDSKKNVVFGRLGDENKGPPALGLGLSIVRTIVEAYHGMVWVEDRVPGDHSKGSVFRVALPMASLE